MVLTRLPATTTSRRLPWACGCDPPPPAAPEAALAPAVISQPVKAILSPLTGISFLPNGKTPAVAGGRDYTDGNPASFPRKRESRAQPFRRSPWAPAFAGVTTNGVEPGHLRKSAPFFSTVRTRASHSKRP